MRSTQRRIHWTQKRSELCTVSPFQLDALDENEWQASGSGSLRIRRKSPWMSGWFCHIHINHFHNLTSLRSSSTISFILFSILRLLLVCCIVNLHFALLHTSRSLFLRFIFVFVFHLFLSFLFMCLLDLGLSCPINPSFLHMNSLPSFILHTFCFLRSLSFIRSFQIFLFCFFSRTFLLPFSSFFHVILNKKYI